MSDYIDTREGWREVGASDNHQRRLVEYGEDNRVAHIWVREAPVPPLPTSPYTVIRVTWSPSYGRTEPSILVKQNEQGWYGDGYAGVPEVLRRDIASFEVLAEPRAVTAKAVIDRAIELAIIVRRDVADIIRDEFGVES